MPTCSLRHLIIGLIISLTPGVSAQADVAALRVSLPNVKIEHLPLSSEEEETLLVKKLRLPK